MNIEPQHFEPRITGLCLPVLREVTCLLGESSSTIDRTLKYQADHRLSLEESEAKQPSCKPFDLVAIALRQCLDTWDTGGRDRFCTLAKTFSSIVGMIKKGKVEEECLLLEQCFFCIGSLYLFDEEQDTNLDNLATFLINLGIILESLPRDVTSASTRCFAVGYDVKSYIGQELSQEHNRVLRTMLLKTNFEFFQINIPRAKYPPSPYPELAPQFLRQLALNAARMSFANKVTNKEGELREKFNEIGRYISRNIESKRRIPQVEFKFNILGKAFDIHQSAVEMLSDSESVIIHKISGPEFMSFFKRKYRIEISFSQRLLKRIYEPSRDRCFDILTDLIHLLVSNEHILDHYRDAFLADWFVLKDAETCGSFNCGVLFVRNIQRDVSVEIGQYEEDISDRNKYPYRVNIED